MVRIPPCAARDVTLVPLDSRSWPSVTTTSRRPRARSRSPTSPSTVRSTLTGRTVGDAVLHHEHERAGLADLHRRRRHGDRLLVAQRQRALTSVPGHSSSSLFGMVARTVTMPVAGSTVFSTIVTWPVARASLAGNDRLERRGLGGERLRARPAGCAAARVKET